MAKPRKNIKTSSKRSVRIQDLQPKKNPKGGRAKLSDISITKPVDKSSPSL